MPPPPPHDMRAEEGEKESREGDGGHFAPQIRAQATSGDNMTRNFFTFRGSFFLRIFTAQEPRS